MKNITLFLASLACLIANFSYGSELGRFEKNFEKFKETLSEVEISSIKDLVVQANFIESCVKALRMDIYNDGINPRAKLQDLYRVCEDGFYFLAEEANSLGYKLRSKSNSSYVSLKKHAYSDNIDLRKEGMLPFSDYSPVVLRFREGGKGGKLLKLVLPIPKD